MIYEKIFLKDFFDGIKTEANVTAYVRSTSPAIEPDRKRASIIVCPGGGYGGKSDRENEPIALEFLARGYNVFVLSYSTEQEEGLKLYPKPLLEAAATAAYIRRNKEKYNATDIVMICGFSSGGHLAASLGTLWNEPVVAETLGVSEGESRPDGMILAYPVITSGEFAHKMSFVRLLGEENQDPKLLHKLSLENSVGAHTPPAFIWHTYTDEGVLMENSMLFAAAMRKANIPFELHIYPDGPHGLSLGTRETRSVDRDRINSHITSWIGLCERWIKRFIDKE